MAPSPLVLQCISNPRTLQLLNSTNIRMVEGMKQIAEDNAKQSESIAIVAYDTKRDSEIMKTVTVVTMVYLPATFVCVRSQTPYIGLRAVHLTVFNVDGVQHGLLQL